MTSTCFDILFVFTLRFGKNRKQVEDKLPVKSSQEMHKKRLEQQKRSKQQQQQPPKSQQQQINTQEPESTDVQSNIPASTKPPR